MIADGLSLYMLMEQLVAALKKNWFQNCDERILEMNEFYQDIRNSEKFEKAKRYYLKKFGKLILSTSIKIQVGR